ncbi:MAG: hypothetical protein A2505_07870 [Deltaproteobacteria bacterium RIFOXYD12_FULL_55_16]|nr:MAG: hypothetical protein A2505_07870 [Deltaproteobacteria bacterium RIFOXYD12_FULL_55_16]
MKLTSIELTNFKAIGEKVVIPVRPITLLFGANSAGKSSILQCLSMLAQSMRVGKMLEPHLFGKGPLVDVGSYRDFIHAHDTSKAFECKFNFDMDADDFFSSIFLCDDDCPKNFHLNNSANKFKAILSEFNRVSISFRFGDASMHDICFYLGDNVIPVFLYSSKVVPNGNHMYWKMYWGAFREEVYAKLYAYPKSVMDGKSLIADDVKKYQESNGKEGIKIFSDKELSRFRKHLAEYSPESLLALYGLLSWHDTPEYQQLKGGILSGKSEFETVFNFYEADNIEQSNYLTEFSGFLPTKFANLAAQDLFFNDQSHWSGDSREHYDGDTFHPAQLLLPVAIYVEHNLALLSHLGPLRREPERIYLRDGTSSKSKDNDGGNYVYRLANDNDLVGQVNCELEQLQVGYQIKIVHLTDQEAGTDYGVFLLQFIDQKTGVAASIKDVGFGFSQILPVIVQCCTARYATVLIEQPELHLHPAMQAELGDMFIRGAFGTVTKKGPGHVPSSWELKQNHFFIETHSEHLILRLLRRIRETTDGELPENVPPITPDDIAVLYVQPGDRGAQVIHIPVTAEGEFATPWPGGFFAERAKELF